MRPILQHLKPSLKVSEEVSHEAGLPLAPAHRAATPRGGSVLSRTSRRRHGPLRARRGTEAPHPSGAPGRSAEGLVRAAGAAARLVAGSRPRTVLDAPSNLGLAPPSPGREPGTRRMPDVLRWNGLSARLGARGAGRVET